MSVINKMLKDLDNRQEQPDTHIKTGSTGVSSASNSTLIGKGSIVLLVVIIILLATISWQIFNGTPVTTAQVASKPAIAQQVIDGVQVEADATEMEPVQAKLADVAPPEVTEQQPAEPQTMPSTMPSVNDTAETVNTQPAAAEPEPELDELTEKEAAVLVDNGTDALNGRSVKNSPSQTVNTQSNSNVKTTTVDSTAPAIADNPKEQPNVFVIEKTSSELTPQERIAKLLSKAKESYDRGYVTEAIEQLTRILSISDSNVEARNLLAAAWYGRGEGNKAVSIINDGLQRYPLIEEWRVTAAKIFFKDNNAAGAFSYLDVNLESASKEFYTLKGNLARELKYYAKAEAAYAQLTKLEPFVGNWWLGLAIAQDSLGKASEAISSYKKVLDVGGVSSQSISFSQNRIDVLQG